MASTFNNDDNYYDDNYYDDNSGDTRSEHSLSDVKLNENDIDDDDEDDDDNDSSDEWLTEDSDDTNVFDDHLEIVDCEFSYGLAPSIAKQQKSVASQTSIELFAVGSSVHVATQTKLVCLAKCAQHQQPTELVSRLLHEQRIVENHPEHSCWYRNFEEEESTCLLCDPEQTAPSELPVLWGLYDELVDTSKCVSKCGQSSAVFRGPEVVLSWAYLSHNDDNEDILALDSQLQHNVKTSENVNSTVTVSNAAELADLGRLSVRDTVADRRQGHRGTKYDENNLLEALKPTADLIALTSRNGRTWHTDFERNSRIWKLLVSYVGSSHRIDGELRFTEQNTTKTDNW